MDDGAPDASKYEDHSGAVIATLQGLRDKAQGQLEEAGINATSSRMNVEIMKQSLEASINFGKKDMERAKKARGTANKTKAVA